MLGSALALAVILLAACGGSSSASISAQTSSPGSSSTAGGGAASSGSGSGAGVGQSGAGALSAEVRATATGDIPDTQLFLTYRDRTSGYQLSYPEGWAQKGGGATVTFRDKNNLIRVVVRRGASPSPAAVTAQLAAERAHTPTLRYGAPATLSIAGAPVVKISYSTISAPDPVTGKRIQLLVDRYVYAHSGRVAILDLATPKGVDNVDAYRRISRSWRWL